VSKTIPIALQAHKEQATTTLCGLLKVGPLPDDSYRGFTSLDVPVDYNDGTGSLTYYARTGLQQSAMVAASDLSVDNAEASSLPPVALYDVEGFTQAQIDSGALDKVEWTLYKVNYQSLSDGHEIVGHGTLGELRGRFGQLTVMELRALSQQAKQTIVELDSRTCRATFGSQPIGTGGGVVEERFPCGYDFSGDWSEGEVTSVGTESDLQFQATLDSNGDLSDGYYRPGVVEWLTGDNAGQLTEVDDVFSGVITLKFPTVNPISSGDTFRIRQDCTKRHDDTDHGCPYWFGADWVNHFRGEPHIPSGDTAALNTPGAGTSGGGLGGSGELLGETIVV
jgi:uncharacterized phage protein (TIGR02218 family)